MVLEEERKKEGKMLKGGNDINSSRMCKGH